MKKIITTICLVMFCCPGMIPSSVAQTAEELERDGLAHFQKAYFEAIPGKDRTKADAEYVLAENAFQEAIRRKPGRVDPYLHLGRTCFVQKKYLKAVNAYEKALNVAPERKETYLQLASALDMAGDYQGAAEVLKELREQEKDEHSLRVLDELINRFEKRDKENGLKKKGGGK